MTKAEDRDRPGPRQLERLVARWRGEGAGARPLGGTNSLLYGFSAGGRELVLRLTPATRRDPVQVEAELDWIRHLVRGGLDACSPVASARGREVERWSAPGAGVWLAVAFERARGQPVDVTDPRVWNERLFTEWGRLSGRLHALTRDFQPRPGRRRGTVDAAALLAFAEAELPQRARPAIEELRAVWNGTPPPRDRRGFGLVHCDVTLTNFTLHEGRLQLFDFDHCCYTWLVYDLAASLYCALGIGRREPPARREAFAERFFRSFLSGYLAEHEIERRWISRLPLFLRLFNLVAYTALHRRGELTLRPDLVDWVEAQLFEERPCTRLDFASIYDDLRAGRSGAQKKP